MQNLIIAMVTQMKARNNTPPGLILQASYFHREIFSEIWIEIQIY